MPRLGAAYDLFGNGKTALKANVSKYMVGLHPLDGRPIATQLVPSVTRTWTDANRNYTPDCDLTSNLAQNNVAAGGDFCGTVSDLRYGQAIPSTRYDPDMLEGMGKRPYNWEFSTGIQQQVAPRVSVDVSYFRRWYGNFTVTDNQAVAASDFGSFTVTAPTDPRLAGGGGYPVGTLYDLNPNKVGQVDNYVSRARNFGKQIDHWNGVDLTMNARPRAGILVQGGMSTGRRTTDTCELREKLPEIATLDSFCHVHGAFVTSVKFLGTYLVPKIDLQLAAAFQNLAGPEILAQTIYTNAQVQGSLGRPLSAGAANVTTNVVDPSTMYGERLTQLDLRVSKILRFSRTRTALNLDIYNVFNGNAIRTHEQQLQRVAAADEHPGRPSLQDQRAVRLLRRTDSRARLLSGPGRGATDLRPFDNSFSIPVRSVRAGRPVSIPPEEWRKPSGRPGNGAAPAT